MVKTKAALGKVLNVLPVCRKLNHIQKHLGNEPKLLTGPTTSKPGPILFKQEAIAEHF